jgi:hypothetical protein
LHDDFERALSGIPPDPKSELPNFLTKEKTLEILEKVLKKNIESVQKIFQKLAP